MAERGIAGVLIAADGRGRNGFTASAAAPPGRWRTEAARLQEHVEALLAALAIRNDMPSGSGGCAGLCAALARRPAVSRARRARRLSRLPGKALPGKTLPRKTLPRRTGPGRTLPGKTLAEKTLAGSTRLRGAAAAGRP
jgi:hypothetical protein